VPLAWAVAVVDLPAYVHGGLRGVALDDRGRIADRVVMRVLGWSAGLRLDIREASGVLTVLTAPDGSYQVTNQGHLRLPAPLRHRCGLETGDRVLLVADPDRSRLAIYLPAALDNLLCWQTKAPRWIGAINVREDESLGCPGAGGCRAVQGGPAQR
jgi:bifunctional DNA-binding transcriptional regulator/antitoxin component of YhaV-PrlF toxin-antitoxin module